MKNVELHMHFSNFVRVRCDVCGKETTFANMDNKECDIWMFYHANNCGVEEFEFTQKVSVHVSHD